MKPRRFVYTRSPILVLPIPNFRQNGDMEDTSAETTAPTNFDALPIELVQRIFFWLYFSEEPIDPLEPPAAVAVSHVSRRWRSIALDY